MYGFIASFQQQQKWAQQHMINTLYTLMLSEPSRLPPPARSSQASVPYSAQMASGALFPQVHYPASPFGEYILHTVVIINLNQNT